ncbi:MAG: YbaK/EbsC family protein [Pyrinomonadaceae bacterium]
MRARRSGRKHSGYQVGGTSPFGTRTQMPVYAERSIFKLPKIYINGGKRGFLDFYRSASFARGASQLKRWK